MSEKKQSKKAALPKNSGPMDVALLASIVKLMQDNDLNTVELRDGEKRVMLKRGAAETVMPVAMPMQYPAAVGGSPPPPAAANGTAEESAKLIEIKSPMVGTFYAAASPDAKPFVTLRSEVSDETDVCVIEAMKVFNNVKAECKGTIAKILVNNGQVVEFGQVLFLVKP
ncbi:MAG: acetyl-CoA carboxylase biotin carboxyl carrier protein [Tepidisphaeraceae bacterium]